MSQISKVYEGYANQPYISDERDLAMWEVYPERFPYAKVEKKQMILLEEGLFPGDIILLWRIGFLNFTNESWFPDYFEYRYGVNPIESIERLKEKGCIVIGNVFDSLGTINAPTIKHILKDKGLKVTGKKQDLIQRLLENVSEEDLSDYIQTRLYLPTSNGLDLISKYDAIIQKHGPKKL